ncbi:MAG: glycosyltransferase family 2 protein, partial [Planctomycetota bacterium]
MRSLIQRTAFVGYAKGLLSELEGADPVPTLTDGPRKNRLTTILVVTHDALDQTRRCLEALRACSEQEHPMEIIFVDNGSTDGTVEFLREQDDVQLICNVENLGAPRARNQALELANGEHIVFMDNDVMVTPGWLGRLLFHAEVDGQSGCVGCLSDRAGQNQQIAYPADSSDPGDLAAYAGKVSEKNHRRYRNQGLMTSFLLMVRREVVDAIGGFDERFSPWGFEDDDFSLRAHLTGFRNRVALDVFVRHEPYRGAKKKAKHDDLLQRNWKRFAKKWGLPKANAYGNCKGLERLDHGRWSHADLRQPLRPTSAQLDSVPSPTRSLSERPSAPETSCSAAGDALELA